MSTPHRYSLRVYYQDTDAGGIVYHANYLAFAERARSEALRAMGISHAEMVRLFGVMFVVRRVELDYQRPARLDDELSIETRILEVGGASVTLFQQFWRDSDSLAVLKVWLGCARVADGRAARMPERWRSRILADIEKGIS
jgi:acyl-CoA thioester hydrolase